MKQRGFRYCRACKNKLQKRGLTAAGTQRWLCVVCNKSGTRPRDDVSKALLLDRFVSWLLGKQSQAELDISDRTWREQTKWCWSITPQPVVANKAYPLLLLDGIRVGIMVCLIARTPEHVVTWQWVPYEASTTWDLLLSRLTAPVVVVCDGQKGILLSITRCWPGTRVQRCHFHVWQNVRSKLTLNPQTDAGRLLLFLTKTLLKGLQTPEEAKAWQVYLMAWEQKFGSFIRERTYASDPRPGCRKWRYTHERLRSAHRQLAKLVKDNQLFTYMDKQLLAQVQQPVPRTTNHVEGGINSQLRLKLKLHRGMSEEHQWRLVDWYLYSRSANQKPPRYCL